MISVPTDGATLKHLMRLFAIDLSLDGHSASRVWPGEFESLHHRTFENLMGQYFGSCFNLLHISEFFKNLWNCFYVSIRCFPNSFSFSFEFPVVSMLEKNCNGADETWGPGILRRTSGPSRWNNSRHLWTPPCLVPWDWFWHLLSDFNSCLRILFMEFFMELCDFHKLTDFVGFFSNIHNCTCTQCGFQCGCFALICFGYSTEFCHHSTVC